MPRALVVVDVQNDFVSGSLAVPDANQVVPAINALLEQPWDLVVATKDWHPANHVSFASVHGVEPGAGVNVTSAAGAVSNEPGWPEHCIQDTWGAELAPGLFEDRIQATVLKGSDEAREYYSAFRDIFQEAETDLPRLLKSHNITEVVVVGLAADFCVMHTALDAAAYGYKTAVLLGATRAITPEGRANALEKLRAAGVRVDEHFDLSPSASDEVTLASG